MTKKDFQLIADVINGLVSDGALALDDERDCFNLAWQFAEALKKENPRFDEQKFFEACGVQKPTDEE